MAIVVGLILIAFGLLYLWKPTIYRRVIWLKTSVAIRTLSEESYKRYIRGLGMVMLIAGLILLIVALYGGTSP